jgi:ribosome-binding ATPase YchF (GTP1/OBG family)
MGGLGSFIPILKNCLFNKKSMVLKILFNTKGEVGAKEAGKWRLERKEYSVQEGDVLHSRFHV